MIYSKTALIEIIRENALRFGDFTLASGKKASYYLDCRQVTLHPAGICQIAAGMLEQLKSTYKDAAIEAVGGMAIGADRSRQEWSLCRASTMESFSDLWSAKKPNNTAWAGLSKVL